MLLALLLQAASPAPPSVTLAEARAMSPSDLAGRLLPDQEHGPMVDAIVNGRGGLTPPSESVYRVWLVERMVPFDEAVCRSHIFEIEMGTGDPAMKPSMTALPTHPIEVEQYDRLWMPQAGTATAATCAAAPPQASGFGSGDFSLRQAADLAEQARAAFTRAGHDRAVSVTCKGEHEACGKNPRQTLAALGWSSLGLVQRVTLKEVPYYVGDPKPADAPWGPAHVQFTFPYAANGATWMITIDRSPAIVAVRMEAQMVIYE